MRRSAAWRDKNTAFEPIHCNPRRGQPSQAKPRAQQNRVHISWDVLYTLHKQVRYRFPRRKTIVSGPSQQWQVDLIDVSRLSRHNQGIKFLLTCDYVFSKKAWVMPLKNKSGISLVAALKSIQHPLPKTLQTDKGTEFLNHTFQQWFKDHKVHFFTTENEDIKASIVERFNRTLKTKLWCYFTHHDTLTYTDILESVVDVYNHTPHRSIGMAPNDVTSANKGRVWLQLYADPMPYKEHTLHVGDTVRISKARRAFKKGYLAQWTEEIFTIVKRKSTQPAAFVLADYSDEVLKGTFYPQELQRWTRQTTCIEWRKYWRGQRMESLQNGGRIKTSSTVGWMWKISCDISFGCTFGFH